MTDNLKIKEDYSLSKCCDPAPDDEIVGYYSHTNIIKVHKKNCSHIAKVEQERLLKLSWKDIIVKEAEFIPGDDFHNLEDIDFNILQHHLDYGIDYSHVVARKLNITKEEAFRRHNNLRELMLLERVKASIVQYRKGIVDNKWIKHRNHTYYQLTQKGLAYLKYYQQNN